MPDIYDIKTIQEPDISRFIDEKIDYDMLKSKYNLKTLDKEVILQGCIEQDKLNPDINCIIKAFNLVKKYETTMVIRPYHIEKSIEIIKKKMPKKINTVYKAPKKDIVIKIKNTKENKGLLSESRFSQVIDFLFKP